MKTTYLLALLLLAILLIGCAKQPIKTTDKTSAKKTCAELNGFKCQQNENCPGNLLQASDSGNCCNLKCQATTSEIPRFDFGNYNDNLGSLQ
ncbi:hypothetical protein J4409_00350 [Candidatus Woesearchaeota archaeon]|nr:hypothetical protein [Candidatus Woesearchaeota archaeon]